MKQTTLLISIIAAIILFGCKNESSEQEKSKQEEQTEIVRIIPVEQLNQVDKLLSEISEKPQLVD